MTLALREAPAELVIERALELVRDGENPASVLAAIVWPSVESRRRLEVADLCKHGHVRTPETTYVGPDGNRRCRLCIRARDAERLPATHHRRFPCVGCGTPCYREGGRCRECWLEARKRLS